VEKKEEKKNQKPAPGKAKVEEKKEEEEIPEKDYNKNFDIVYIVTGYPNSVVRA
jgi:hypothetical protein